MKPTVVFLHGLARSHRSLARLRRAVARAGYPTWTRSYPSRRLELAALADWLAQAIHDDLGDRPLFGVTHSLGGVLVRHLADRLPWRGVVMLARPNHGSRVAAAFKDNRSIAGTSALPASRSSAQTAGRRHRPRSGSSRERRACRLLRRPAG